MPWLINRNGLHFLFFSNLLINLWSATWTGSFANLLDGWQMLLNRGEKGEGLSVYVWILSAWIPLVVLFYYSLGHWYYCSGWRGSRVPAHRRECRVTCEISLHRKPVCFFLSISISNPPFTIYRVSHLLLRWERWGAPSRGGAWPQFETFCQKLWTLDSLQRRSESEMNGGGLEKKRERLATNWRYQIALRAEKILMWLAHVSSGEKLR